MLSCLGFYETGVNLVTWDGDGYQKTDFVPSDFQNGGDAVTSGSTTGLLRISPCIVLISNDCPNENQIINPAVAL